jgi:hypothetical protein
MQERLIAGDSLNFATTALGYPASEGWALRFELRMRDAAGTPIDLTTTAEGDDHRLQVVAAVTDGWAPGIYSWRSYVSKGAEKYTVETGTTEIVASPSTATSLDLRTGAQRALEAVQAVLLGKATNGTYYYRIGDRELRAYTMPELLALETKLKNEVRREKRAQLIEAGMADPRRTVVRMGRA